MARALDRLRAETFPAVRGRALRPLVRHRELQFPTFPAELHDAIATKQDYFRYATLGLAVQRVLDEDIAGAFAEVGVWRGETSAFLHALAPDAPALPVRHVRGLPRRGSAAGRRRPRASATPARPPCGRASARPQRRAPPGLRARHAGRASRTRRSRSCCSTSTCSTRRPPSLEFFYPRLSPGGYLVVHDYNNPESDWACKRAFDGFLADKPEQVVELGDMWGSALVRRAG